jgi:16S rRNA (guanine(527)-N(7))-methyltransferase RsmG
MGMNIPNGSQAAWHEFVTKMHLTEHQAQQFERYFTLLNEWNAQMNLTAITEPRSIIKDHFQDSLSVTAFYNIAQARGLCDVGSGAGFPGIPLGILYPQVPLYIIEVNKKKVQFMSTVCKELGIEALFYDLDWRTFLRKTSYPIDLFVARASLQPEELIRMFKPSSPYNRAQLVYWASKEWQPSEIVAPYIVQDNLYSVGSKKRRLIFFSSITTKAG